MTGWNLLPVSDLTHRCACELFSRVYGDWQAELEAQVGSQNWDVHLRQADKRYCQMLEFLKRLPFAALVDAAEKSISKLGMGERAFNYFCGICRNKIFEQPTRVPESDAQTELFVVVAIQGPQVMGGDEGCNSTLIGPAQSEAGAEAFCLELAERYELACGEMHNESVVLPAAIEEEKWRGLQKQHSLPSEILWFGSDLTFDIAQIISARGGRWCE